MRLPDMNSINYVAGIKRVEGGHTYVTCCTMTLYYDDDGR